MRTVTDSTQGITRDKETKSDGRGEYDVEAEALAMRTVTHFIHGDNER